jgi:hypothetical protein
LPDPTLELSFIGRFQCRLATDPDPFDHPRGLRGISTALPGEPDLDRVIQTNPRQAFYRANVHPIGIYVYDSKQNGTLHWSDIGAEVNLLPGNAEDGPFFEGRNRLLAAPGDSTIQPFRLVVEKAGRRIATIAADKAEHAKLQWRGEGENLMKKFTGEGYDPPSVVGDIERYLIEQSIKVSDYVFKAEAAQSFKASGTCGNNRPAEVEFLLGCWDYYSLSGVMLGKVRCT